MTSDHSEDPYRSPMVGIDDSSAGSTPQPLEVVAVLFLASVLGIAAFFGTCFGTGLAVISVYGLYGQPSFLITASPWIFGGVAGVAAAYYSGRAMFHGVRNRHRRTRGKHDDSAPSAEGDSGTSQQNSVETNS